MSDPDMQQDVPIPVQEHNRLLLEIHKAMRVDSERLISAVTTIATGDTHRAAELGRTFAVIVNLIHRHHWTEDDVLYPFLIDRVPGFEAEAVRLEDDHVELDAVMARVNARFRLVAHPLSRGVWQDTYEHLARDVTLLRDVLAAHLEREEAVVIPAVEGVAAADALTLSEAAMKHTNLREMSQSVPWIMAHLTAEEEAELRASAPKLLAVLHDHVWERRFRHLMEPLYGTAAR